jgi:hypothetical protein
MQECRCAICNASADVSVFAPSKVAFVCHGCGAANTVKVEPDGEVSIKASRGKQPTPGFAHKKVG